MEISLVVKKNIIEDMAYHCKSCVYCQASVSLLSRTIKDQSIDTFKDFFQFAEKMFTDNNLNIQKKWNGFVFFCFIVGLSRGVFFCLGVPNCPPPPPPTLLQGNCVLLAFEDLIHDPIGLEGLFGDCGMI